MQVFLLFRFLLCRFISCVGFSLVQVSLLCRFVSCAGFSVFLLAVFCTVFFWGWLCRNRKALKRVGSLSFPCFFVFQVPAVLPRDKMILTGFSGCSPCPAPGHNPNFSHPSAVLLHKVMLQETKQPLLRFASPQTMQKVVKSKKCWNGFSGPPGAGQSALSSGTERVACEQRQAGAGSWLQAGHCHQVFYHCPT